MYTHTKHIHPTWIRKWSMIVDIYFLVRHTRCMWLITNEHIYIYIRTCIYGVPYSCSVCIYIHTYIHLSSYMFNPLSPRYMNGTISPGSQDLSHCRIFRARWPNERWEMGCRSVIWFLKDTIIHKSICGSIVQHFWAIDRRWMIK